VTAELTRWYGIDVGGLPVERRLGLWACLPSIQAQERIDTERYDPENYEQVYNLFLAAYGDEGRASEARLESLKRIVRSETEAARQAQRT
jgi:hypothetical protein